MSITVTDFFCGAGGSSTGAHAVPGVHVRLASNHWQLAIDSHNANHPDTDHDMADISGVDPARYPRTDIGWFSPECTTWSQARGQKRDYADPSRPQTETLFDADSQYDAPLPDEAIRRSRATMGDVLRFSRHHLYEVVIVENVVDVRAWALFDEWLGEMHKIGYLHHEVYLNSMHAWGMGEAAPQSRDRAYFVFWKAGNRRPDFEKWLSPPAWCPACARMVRARQWWKNPGKQLGKYGPRAQYLYRCPSPGCHEVVEPVTLPAARAIDWDLPAGKIGDRTKDLAPKTRARIAAGIQRYARPFTAQVAGNTFERRPGVRTRPVDMPLATLHTTAATGLAVPPMLVPSGGTWRDDAASVLDPMAARTTRENDALCVPPLVVPLRTHGTAATAQDPFKTFVAGNAGMGLVMRNNTPRGALGQMTTPSWEPMRTLTTAGHQSVIHVPARALYSYDTGSVRSTLLPLPTQTTVEGDAVMALPDLTDPATLERIVDESTFRMLTPAEMASGMAFPLGYVVLGTKTEQTKQIGNAVTPPPARDLIAAAVESITGETLSRWDWAVAA